MKELDPEYFLKKEIRRVVYELESGIKKKCKSSDLLQIKALENIYIYKRIEDFGIILFSVAKFTDGTYAIYEPENFNEVQYKEMVDASGKLILSKTEDVTNVTVVVFSTSAFHYFERIGSYRMNIVYDV